MSAPAYRPATRWCSPDPFGVGRRPVPRKPVESTEHALRAMLQSNLARGHWRLAIRHFLMLQAGGWSVGSELSQRCDAYIETCSRQDLQKIRTTVCAWAELVGAGAPHAL